LQAALRAVSASLGRDIAGTNELVKSVLARGLPHLGEVVAQAQVTVAAARELQLAAMGVHDQLERVTPQVRATVRAVAAAVERANVAQIAAARGDLGRLAAAADGHVDADAVAAALERSDNPGALFSDLMRAVARATLALESAPPGASGTLNWRDMVALFSLLVGLLPLFGVEFDLSPEAPAPVVIELSEPAIGELERYVDERVHELLEERDDTPADTAAPAETSTQP
jgi:hypothetical protein